MCCEILGKLIHLSVSHFHTKKKNFCYSNKKGNYSTASENGERLLGSSISKSVETANQQQFKEGEKSLRFTRKVPAQTFTEKTGANILQPPFGPAMI